MLLYFIIFILFFDVVYLLFPYLTIFPPILCVLMSLVLSTTFFFFHFLKKSFSVFFFSFVTPFYYILLWHLILSFPSCILISLFIFLLSSSKLKYLFLTILFNFNVSFPNTRPEEHSRGMDTVWGCCKVKVKWKNHYSENG